MSQYRKCQRSFFALIVGFVLFGSCAVQAAFTFTQIDFPGAAATNGRGINDNGEIVGIYSSCVGLCPNYGFSRDAGGVLTQIVPPFSQFTGAWGINAASEIVGSYLDFGNARHGYLDIGGTYTPIDFPGATSTEAYGINSAGVIVGSYVDTLNKTHGFQYIAPSAFTQIDFPAATSTLASGINSAGVIVGSYVDTLNKTHGFQYTGPNTFTAIDVPFSGTTRTDAAGISSAGVIVGAYIDASNSQHGFLMVGGTFTSFDIPGAVQTNIVGINSNGQISGTFADSTGAHAFIATPSPVLLTVAGTGPFQNQLMVVDPNTCSAKAIGVTQDSSSGPVRRIRGLAYSPNGTLYGVTREGDIVQIDRFTGKTMPLGTVDPSAGYSPLTEFWSGLALDPTGTALYAVNAFGTRNLARFTLPSGPAVQLGPTTAFNFNFQVLGLAFEPGVTPATMYGANRNNDNIVEVNPLTGALNFTLGGAVVPGNNRQQITVHPFTNEIWGIHDHSPFSNNAALHTVVSPFPTGSNTPICQLPFAIVETVGGGNDTYGWGGLTFVPDDYNVPWNSCSNLKMQPNQLPFGNATNGLAYSASLSVTSNPAPVLSWSSVPTPPFPGVSLNATTGQLTGIPTSSGAFGFVIQVTTPPNNGVLCNGASRYYMIKVF